MKFNIIAYILIGILIVIILFQNKCSSPTPPKETRDTVVVYEIIHDTTPGKPLPPKIQKDTVWLKEDINTPDTTYEGLLKQYTELGNKLYAKKTYSTSFKIKDYGSIIVNDTIKGNELIGSSITTDLKIPTTTVTVKKEVPYRALYFGPEITGNRTLPINGIYGRALFKTKKDHIYSISGGWNGEIVVGGGMYWRINN